MVALHYAARSDVGLVRKNNQDSAYAGTNLLAVADGMGGHAGGDIASSLAIGNLIGLDGDAPGADALQELEIAIRAAHDAIRERVLDEPELSGMGTTVTALLRHGNRLALAHIGDSRAYLLREGELTQVTQDHTFVQKLVDDGQITPDEADRHPQRNIVLRVIGDVDSSAEVDTSVREATVGDRWLICSDGLSGFVSRETLTETLNQVRDPGTAADQLVQLALRAGGSDNITCIVADVVDDAREPVVQPQVVGAAATDRARPTAAPAGSAAAKAAALTRSATLDTPEVEYTDDEPDDTGPGRALKGALAAIVVLAVVAAGLYGAWVWSQNQYYVGVDGGNVAIYQGLPGTIGPLTMSHVHTTSTTLPVNTLPTTTQQRVTAGIGADDLADAQRIVANLFGESSVCDIVVTQVPVVPGPSGTSTGLPTETALPTVTATGPPGTQTGTPGDTQLTPTPSSSPSTRPVPPECAQN